MVFGITFNKSRESYFYISLDLFFKLRLRMIFGNHKLYISAWIFTLCIDPLYKDRRIFSDDPWNPRVGYVWKKNIIDI